MPHIHYTWRLSWESLNVLNAIVCSSCCWFLSIVRVPFSNIFQDCTVPKGCFFRLSLGLKMIEVCWSNLTLPIPYSSFNFCFLSNIEFQSLMVSDAFNSLTHRVLQRFTFLHQPIVLIILRPQLSTPQHQVLVFCLSCTGGQGTSRRILGSYRFQVVPIVSSSRENGWKW